MIRVYTYAKCDTCRKATKWLGKAGLPFEEVAIRETPPTVAETLEMLKHQGGQVRKLFNVSGQDYRDLGIKERVDSMTPKEAASLLSKNGNLVKRPFLLAPGVGLVGFNEALWTEKLLA